MPQLRALLLTLWLLLCFLFGFLLSLTRWKNPIWNRFVLNAFGFGARYIGGVRIHPIDKHRSDSVGPCVYVANHQSGLDMAVYGTVFPKLGVMVGKRELVYVPILGWFFVGGGNVMINRGNRRSAVGSLAEAVDRIKRKGHSICIFPEGTRNKSLEGFLPFKKGAFYLAIDAQCPIIPVVATSYKNVGTMESGAMRGGDIYVRMLEPIYTNGLTHDSVDELSQRVRARMEEAYRELNAKL